MFGKSKPIEIKSVDELALMRQAARCRQDTGEDPVGIAVGMTTADLDALARESIADHVEQHHLSSGTTDFRL